MRLVLDLESLQKEMRSGVSSAWLELAVGMARERGAWDMHVVLSEEFGETILPIRRAFRGVLPAEAIRTWQGPEGSGPSAERAGWPAAAGRLLRKTLIAELEPDAICILPSPGGDGAAAGEVGDDSLHPWRTVRLALPVGNVECTAQESLARCADVCKTVAAPPSTVSPPAAQLRLAYISPLPPQRSGIADYSAEILPELARHYAIEVVAQDTVSDQWIKEHCPIRSLEWFREHAHEFDRVLYHFGNSEFHRHMFGMLREIPGTVILHDFFLGHVQAFREMHEVPPLSWVEALYRSHGYRAVQERFASPETAMWTYPANLEVLQRARGVIVHSRHICALGRRWYGEEAVRSWDVVPLPRLLPPVGSREDARRKLGIPTDRFVVCSFGVIGPSKLNHRLLDAWCQSSSSRAEGFLVFVGADPGGEYGERLLQASRRAGLDDRVLITGWVDGGTFGTWLAAADVAVQLRGASRGETSAAVLDCMAHGLPTIVNASGALAEIDRDAVVLLPDVFKEHALAAAIDRLRTSPETRAALGHRARLLVQDAHGVEDCVGRYASAIERFARAPIPGMLADLAKLVPADDGAGLVNIAEAIAVTFPARPRPRQILLDVSITQREDLRTGIQRVVRALTLALLAMEVPGWHVEPVYALPSGGGWRYRYARAWTAGLLGLPVVPGEDDPIEANPGDLLLALDLATPLVPDIERANLYRDFANRQVEIAFVVYDVLPLLMPAMFPPGRRDFHDWFATVARVADKLICISQSVAREVGDRLPAEGAKPHVAWFHLGGDLENSAPTHGVSREVSSVVAQVAGRHAFLMVGTVEPRKGHLVVLDAFERLWARGADVDLVIVGAEGWRSVPVDMRRTIPRIVQRLSNHPEAGKRLFWLRDASDESLDCIYDSSTCLIAASEGEGFGLPLVEGARRGLPIIARDIPVFREVAGDHAHYFSGGGADELASAIESWIELYRASRHPRSDGLHRITWRESAEQLLAAVGVTAKTGVT